MFRVISNFTWIFLAIGVWVLFADDARSNRAFFDNYTMALKIYLFGMGAYLVLKRVIFYRLKGNVNIVSLIKKSDYQNNLLAQGIVLALLGLVYVQAYRGGLQNFDTIVIGLLGIYYFAQVLLNSNPTIYLDDNSFSYDDYFIDKWNWADLRRIDFDDEKIRLVDDERDFELDFQLVDELDYRKLTDEVENNILDGEFGRDKTSKSLIEIIENYATDYDVKMNT